MIGDPSRRVNPEPWLPLPGIHCAFESGMDLYDLVGEGCHTPLSPLQIGELVHAAEERAAAAELLRHAAAEKARAGQKPAGTDPRRPRDLD